jgi:hypothetical protein
MEFNTNEIKFSGLNMSPLGQAVIQLVINPSLKKEQEITDEMYSYIVNPPPIYASADKNTEKRQKEDYQRYVDKKEESLSLVRLVKKQFYDFLCTESEYYKKERASIGGNINLLITGVSAAIATKVANVEIGIVTSFVTCFMIVLGKMGKKAMCEYYQPKTE